MAEQNSNTEEQTQSQESKAPAREIIRGRMPVAVVALVRFGSMKDQAVKAKAEAFGTTVGKIDDIVKNRNFAYVTEDFRPTAQQKADGIEWLKRHPQGADSLIAELEAIEEATAEQSAAFEAARAANRGQSATTKEGEPANAGGGNRRGNGKGKKNGGNAEAAPADGATGEALLS